MTDALLDAIVAAPDDDAPRLVWADREGGERGELVVVQCTLARHDVSFAQRTRLIERERELLEKSSYAWAGFHHVAWKRGFVDRITVPLDDLRTPDRVERLFVKAPLLAGLRLERITEDVNRFVGPDPDEAWSDAARKLRQLFERLPPGRIRTLDVSAHVHATGDWSDPGRTNHFDAELLALLAEAPSLSSMRELVMIDTGLRPEHVPAVARLNLERLQLGAQRLGGDGVVRLLREAPSLTRLAIWAGTPRLHGEELTKILACPEVARLTELDLFSNTLGADDLSAIGSCVALASLERLGIGWSTSKGIAAVMRSPHLASLRELDVYGVKHVQNELRGATFVKSLRALRIPQERTGEDFSFLTALERIEFAG